MEDEYAAVHGAVYRVLLVSRVFGLAPLSFKRRHTVAIVRVRNALVYYGYLLFSILNMILVLGITIHLWTARRWTYQDSSTVGSVIMFIVVGTTTVVVSAAIYGARRRMKYLLLLLQQLNKIIILIPNETSYVKDRRRTLAASVVMLLLIFTFVTDFIIPGLFMYYLNPPQLEMAGMILLFGSTQVHCVIIAMLVVQIVVVMYTIRTAVESFNSELKRMLNAIAKGSQGDDIKEVMLFKVKECLWRISRYYLTLCENIRRMNSQDGALLLLVLVFLVVQLMDKSYSFITRYTSKSPTDHLDGLNYYLQNAMRLYLTLLYVTMLGVLVNACDTTQEELKKMRLLVSELMYRSRRTGETFSTAAGVLCELVLLHQPTFKPLCACALTRSLFITVISGVITYLVTVIKIYTMEEGIEKEKA